MTSESIQRRLAAILAADVVGYSRLMEADEIGTLARLKSRQKEVLTPLVAKHKGRLFKVTGDGVLVEFASAVAAVQCAIELQQKFAEANESTPEDRHIVLRIGINLGDVMVEGGDLYGDGVNIAARLEGLADPGGILVSGSAHEQVRNKVAVEFEDIGLQSLKNIAELVRAYRAGKAREASFTAAKPSSEKPSIAVLPFINMSGDPEQEYLADGLTEDIITALSRSVQIAVIARTSTFVYKGKSRDIKRIAEELDAAFVIEGSVRRLGNRIRITAQLIDGSSGAHLWADNYDGTLNDIFDIQDQITRSVAASTQTKIWSSAHRTPAALDLIRSPAYRISYEAMGYMYQMTLEARAKAAELGERALAIDPDCALAHRIRANAYVLQLSFCGLPHTPENVEHGVALAREAMRRAPEDEFTHWMMAFALAEAGRFEEAVGELDIGLAMNPNASMLLGDKGDYLILMGRTEEGMKLCELALTLNPRDPIGYWWENCVATAFLIQGDAEKALYRARQSSLTKPDHIRAVIVWAAAAGTLERKDEAREAVGRCLARFPGMTLANVIPHYQLPFRRPEDNRCLLEGLRKAGLPE